MHPRGVDPLLSRFRRNRSGAGFDPCGYGTYFFWIR